MSKLTTEQITARVISVTAVQYGMSKHDMTPETRFTDDLGGDSLDGIEMVMAIEEEFEVEISDAEAEKLQTVADVVALVERLLA